MNRTPADSLRRSQTTTVLIRQKDGWRRLGAAPSLVRGGPTYVTQMRAQSNVQPRATCQTRTDHLRITSALLYQMS